MNVSKMRPTLDPPRLNLLLFPIKVPAGFPSPAQDYLAKRIDLNDLLVKHPSSTFYVQASGDSMYPDICDGDILVVDRNAEISNGCTVLACIDNEFCVKQYFKRPDGSIELLSVNPDYPPVNLLDECTFEIWVYRWGCRCSRSARISKSTASGSFRQITPYTAL